MPAVGLRRKSIPRLVRLPKREAQRRLVEAILPERTEEHAPAIQGSSIRSAMGIRQACGGNSIACAVIAIRNRMYRHRHSSASTVLTHESKCLFDKALRSGQPTCRRRNRRMTRDLRSNQGGKRLDQNRRKQGVCKASSESEFNWEEPKGARWQSLLLQGRAPVLDSCAQHLVYLWPRERRLLRET
jgi:hypothetical protein